MSTRAEVVKKAFLELASQDADEAFVMWLARWRKI